MSEKHEERYYVAAGKDLHDAILRCTECQKIVQFAMLKKLGGCPECGCRRVREITTLKQEEYDAISSGALVFPDSDKFLKEFAGVAGT